MNAQRPTGFVLAATLLAATLLGACAAPPTSSDVSRNQVMRAQAVDLGVVESVRPVQITGSQSGVGVVGGAALGGIAGSTLGSGSRASAAGAIAGAIAGGLAGNAIEQGVTRTNGIEVTVKLDSGRMIAITQADGNEGFRAGDRVRVLSDGQTTRVTR